MTILEREPRQGKGPIVVLSGGVGGARLCRGLAAVVSPDQLTIVVNVGDDAALYGLSVSPDLDTVLYTLAGIEGPNGWGIAGDAFTALDRIAGAGIDTRFRIGDVDLMVNLARTLALGGGEPLSSFTARAAAALRVPASILPATDRPSPTRVRVSNDGWLDFQDYFVSRGHRDTVEELDFVGAATALPAPGVVEAIAAAAAVIIAPSNPPLSIWPILAIPAIRDAVASAPRVVAVSPLFGGAALKGPADRVMASLGLPAGNAGIVAAYDGLLSDLVIDTGDSGDAPLLAGSVKVHVADTHIALPHQAAGFGRRLLALL